MKKNCYIVLGILFGVINSIFGQYTYDYCIYEKEVPSEIVKNEFLGIMDTTAVSISGRVISKITNEPLHGCAISIEDFTLNNQYELFTDQNGEFRVMGGIYNGEIRASFLGYSDLKGTIELQTGEVRKLTIEMGDAGGWNTYEINSKSVLTNKQVKKRVRQIVKENKKNAPQH